MSEADTATAIPMAASSSSPGLDPLPPLLEGPRGEIKQSVKDKLEAKIAFNERLAELCGVAVVVGLAIELIFAFAFRDKKPGLEYWPQIISDTIITLGVAGEVLFARKASAAQAKRQEIADERIAELNKLAADARERTAILEKLTAWRHITEQQKTDFIAGLKALAPALDVRIEHENGDVEAFSYAREIALAFSEAGVHGVTQGSNSWFGVQRFGLNLSGTGDVTPMVLSIFVNCRIDVTLFEYELVGSFPNLVINPNLWQLYT